MRYIVLLPLFILLLQCKTQDKTLNLAETDQSIYLEKPIIDSEIAFFDFYISFNSVCCGPTDSMPLRSYTETFLLQHNLMLNSIYRLGPMGREGEYAFGIIPENWTENQKKQYIDGLKKIEWIDANTDIFGGVHISENKKIDSSSFFPLAKIKKLTYSSFISEGF